MRGRHARRRALLLAPLGLLLPVPFGARGQAAGTSVDSRAQAATTTVDARASVTAATIGFPDVVPGRPLAFPRDHGAHPDHRIEWWYVTGWLWPRGSRQRAKDAAAVGFQVTFFRTRTAYASDNPSRFAPRQILIAHAALADPRIGHLLHDQRIARAGFGIAEASEATTDVRIDDWRLALSGSDYETDVPAREFALRLRCRAAQPPLAQGDSGFSRKGPGPLQASWYYSRPGLAVEGKVTRGSDRAGGHDVEGIAWLDHEWSSEILDDAAVGWDWTGLNLDDGALMAFRMRGRDGGLRWAAATRVRDGTVLHFAPDEVSIVPLRRWRSPRTGTGYPVSIEVRCGDEAWTLQPLMDDQELDSRATTGAVYWEGAVRAERSGREVGQGYLELTGYLAPMRF